MAGFVLSGTVILSNFASISPSFDTVTSYCIVSPGLVNVVLNVAVVSVCVGSDAFVGVPFTTLLWISVIFTLQLLVILLVPLIFN
ncbi:unknown [Firmicutes bacterium CAG:822]|nr:unknown [Firmicutes bacterium CAG:822]